MMALEINFAIHFYRKFKEAVCHQRIVLMQIHQVSVTA